MTLANRISILRILLIPIFMVVYLQAQKYDVLKNWALGIFAFAILTDLLDGAVARMRGERTRLGSFLDPLADKLLITATFVALTYLGTIELWILVIIFSRDLIIVLGWAIIYILTNSSEIRPRILGKISTLLQMGSAIALLFPVPELLADWLVKIMLLFTLFSAADYILVGSKKLEPIPR